MFIRSLHAFVMSLIATQSFVSMRQGKLSHRFIQNTPYEIRRAWRSLKATSSLDECLSQAEDERRCIGSIVNHLMLSLVVFAISAITLRTSSLLFPAASLVFSKAQHPFKLRDLRFVLLLSWSNTGPMLFRLWYTSTHAGALMPYIRFLLSEKFSFLHSFLK